ncbi:unnamed protein product [Gordionus sp. m RMFG-2023]
MSIPPNANKNEKIDKSPLKIITNAKITASNNSSNEIKNKKLMYHNVILSEESFTEISKENFKSNIDKYFGEKVNVNKIDLIDLTHCNHSNSLKDISVINLSCSSVDEPINLESFDNNLTDSLDNGKDIGYKDEIKIYPTKNNTAKDILKQTTANPSYNQLTSNSELF